jgi:hypothetical protein
MTHTLGQAKKKFYGIIRHDSIHPAMDRPAPEVDGRCFQPVVLLFFLAEPNPRANKNKMKEKNSKKEMIGGRRQALEAASLPWNRREVARTAGPRSYLSPPTPI